MHNSIDFQVGHAGQLPRARTVVYSQGKLASSPDACSLCGTVIDELHAWLQGYQLFST